VVVPTMLTGDIAPKSPASVVAKDKYQLAAQMAEAQVRLCLGTEIDVNARLHHQLGQDRIFFQTPPGDLSCRILWMHPPSQVIAFLAFCSFEFSIFLAKPFFHRDGSRGRVFVCFISKSIEIDLTTRVF